MTRRVVVVGATGTIGRPVCAELAIRGDQVVVFSRDPQQARRTLPAASGWLQWDTEHVSAEAVGELRCADAVIYLAGAALFDGHRHDRADIEAETAARATGISQLMAAVSAFPPAVLIAASSVGYYGYRNHDDDDRVETSPPGDDWWGRSSARIEAAAEAAASVATRTVLLRTGYVLTAATVASQAARFRRHLGGWIGTGTGWTPWIHTADVTALILAALGDPRITGPLNATSPSPVRTRRFAAELGSALGRHAWLPVPTPMARMGLGVVTDILVHGKRVLPAKATAHGLAFQYPTLDVALPDLLGTDRPR